MKLIVLDRDGVINKDSDAFIKSPDEWVPIPGSIEAIAKLTHAGYKIVIATNQSGIARGLLTAKDLENIHEKMQKAIKSQGGEIYGIFICPHGPNDNCECRKPKPGLLFEISKKFNILPKDMLVIGDSLRDLLAAKSCGACAILVKTGKGELTFKNQDIGDTPVFNDLAAAADAIIDQKITCG
ncbi:MAG: D-glycero-beta-D-manno-heptose 1,7-bisphosphate 7-phosphatase [Gammaproteobacteria bacterium]|nr:D-glycero-beta-D-manno-heptose 1,7-bisphosphate 7-phosphatase [Gammaproteobacteria bacterium]